MSIKDTYFGERIVRSYDYFIGDIREQALNVLVERDIKPTGQVICLDGEYILVSDSFDNRLK